MCLEKVRLLSNMTPKLRAELTDERVTPSAFNFLSYCGRPMRRNSVLEGLRERKLVNEMTN